VTTSGTTIDGRIKLITLVIAYNDGDTDTIRYWVNQGQDAVTYTAARVPLVLAKQDQPNSISLMWKPLNLHP